MIITGNYPNLRLRRNRKTDWSRRLTQENNLSVNDLILPIFVVEGKKKKQVIKNMPGVYRYSIDNIPLILDKAVNYKIPMVAIFPYTNQKLKNNFGSEALNENNLVCRAIRYIKKRYKIGRVRLLLKEPRSTLSWHRDPEPRLHIPIYTNPGAIMVIDKTAHHMPADGSVWVTNNLKYHNAFNGGEENRVHLVACILDYKFN